MTAPADLLAALFALLLVGAWRCGAEPDASPSGTRVLKVDMPRAADSTRIGGPPARYRLVGLQPGKGYEVRVSFPGTAAVRVALWLDSSSNGGGGAGSGGELLHHLRSRRLFDAEKIMFGTDAGGRVWLHEQHRALPLADVLFRAEAWGRWRQPGQAPQELVYDIVLEQSTLGVLRSAQPLLATAVLLVLMVAAAVPWWSSTAAPAILRWLNDSSAGGSGGGSEASAGAPDSSFAWLLRSKRVSAYR